MIPKTAIARPTQPDPIRSLGPLWSDLVIKLVSVLFGKCNPHYPRGYAMLTNGNQTTVW